MRNSYDLRNSVKLKNFLKRSRVLDKNISKINTKPKKKQQEFGGPVDRLERELGRES